MKAGLELLSEQFTDGTLDPAVDPEAAAQPIINAANIAPELEKVAAEDPDLVNKLKEKFLLETAGTAGKAAGVAGSSLVASLALALMGLPGVDAAALWLIETLPTLLEIYTSKSPPEG